MKYFPQMLIMLTGLLWLVTLMAPAEAVATTTATIVFAFFVWNIYAKYSELIHSWFNGGENGPREPIVTTSDGEIAASTSTGNDEKEHQSAA